MLSVCPAWAHLADSRPLTHLPAPVVPHRDEEVNYFPSRFDPARNAAPTPMNKATMSGRRERAVIVKENNFQQVGVTHRMLVVWGLEGQQAHWASMSEWTHASLAWLIHQRALVRQHWDCC